MRTEAVRLMLAFLLILPAGFVAGAGNAEETALSRNLDRAANIKSGLTPKDMQVSSDLLSNTVPATHDEMAELRSSVEYRKAPATLEANP